MMLKRSTLVLACTALQPALAQEAIVVTASRLPRSVAESHASQITLEVEQLRAQAGLNLDDQLRSIAGFQTFRRASSRVTQPTTQGATLRAIGGNGASRALVLRDGVPLEDPFGGWIPWSAISGMSVGKMRIVRGGGGVTAGSGALTGVIDIESSVVASGLHAAFNGGAGSFGTVKLDARLSAADDRRLIDVSAGLFRSDGYTLVPETQRGSIDLPARSNARNITARLQSKISDDSYVQASFLHFTEDKVNGLALAPNATTGTDVSIRLVRDVPDDRWSYALLGYAKWRDFSSGFATALPGRTAAIATLDQYDVPAQGFGGGIEIRPPKFSHIALRLGVDAKTVSGETNENFRSIAGAFTRNRTAGGTSTVLGGFIDASTTPIEHLTLSAGVRLDRWWLRSARRVETDIASAAVILNDQAQNRRGSQWSGRIGVTYAVTPALSARALLYSGWRLPTLGELHRPFRVGNDVTEANAALTPERLRGIDVGLHYEPLNTLSFDLTLFANKLRDAIGNISKGAGPGVFPGVGFLPAGGVFRQRDNIDAVRVRGVELQGKSQLPYGISLDASLVYADGKIVQGNVELRDKRLTQAPKWQTSGQLGWRGFAERLNAAVTVRHVSSVFEDDQNLRLLPAYTTVDAVLDWRFQPGLSVRVSGENLADTQIVSAIASNGILTRTSPRSFNFGVSVEF
jgi:vitamin B12 transporter